MAHQHNIGYVVPYY